MQNNLKSQGVRTADSLISKYDSIPLADLTDEQIVAMSEAYAITNRIDQSINTLLKALPQRSTSGPIRFALSSAFRAKFYSVLSVSASKVNLNLDILDRAIAYDPSNFGFNEDIAKLSKFGITSNPESIALIRTQLVTRGASYASRLLLADAAIAAKEYSKAASHYEVILAELPKMTLALNRLALLQLNLDSRDTDKALRLIDHAIEIAPNVAELYDSKGMILSYMDRDSEAIEQYQVALEKDPRRIETMRKLIPLLEVSGQEQLAMTYTKRAEMLEKALQARARGKGPASSESKSGEILKDTDNSNSSVVDPSKDMETEPPNSDDGKQSKLESKSEINLEENSETELESEPNKKPIPE